MAKGIVPDGFVLDIINQKLHRIPTQDHQTPKPRVRWIWSKYFGCWQWATANASGLLPGLRTADEERDFHARRGMFGGWMQ